MPGIRFADDAAMYDATPLENLFIIEDLPYAPDMFLKIYIYARMLCLHPEAGDVSELTKALDVTEENVEDAFRYWEQRGYMRRVADRPPEYVFLPVRSAASGNTEDYPYLDFHRKLQSLFTGGKMVRPAQLSLASDWIQILHFTQEGVLALIERTIARSRSSAPDPASVFRTADKTAQRLSELGITDRSGVERELDRDGKADSAAAAVLERFGLHRTATKDEQALAGKWIGQWKLTAEEILAACKELTRAQNPSFAYLDRVLDSKRSGEEWHEEMKQVLERLGSRTKATKEQCMRYAEWRSAGFEHGTILLAAEQQARKGRGGLDSLELLLGRWKERGLLTAADAEAFVRKGQALLREYDLLLERAGIESRPTEDDLAEYARWKEQLPAEVIRIAAEEARGRSWPLTAMRARLEKWIRDGVRTEEAARAALAAKHGKGDQPGRKNPALEYEQRDYRQEEFDDSDFLEVARKLDRERRTCSNGPE